MSYLRLALGCALVLLPALVYSGESRTWTDNQGREIEAEFVRVFNGMVILKQANRILRVPVSNLSPADLEIVNNGGEVPAVQEVPTPLDQPTEPQKRTWTDQKGNQLEATYVRVHENKVVLISHGRVQSFLLEDFSDGDHAYIKQQLIAEGEQAKADMLDQYVATKREEAEQALAANRNRSPSPSPSRPSYRPPSTPAIDRMQANMEETRRQMAEMQERTRRETEAAMAEARESVPSIGSQFISKFEEQRRQNEEAREARSRERNERVANHNSTPNTPPVARPSNYPQPTELASTSTPDYNEQYEDIYECSNCKQEVPAHIGAGGECPHCGITFDYVEDENGNKTYSPGSWGKGLFIAILAICGGVIRFFFAFQRGYND